MFGGLCFMLHGNMCVGVSHTSLIVRLGPEQADLARGQPHVVEFDVAGRPLRGGVMVEADGIETDEQLRTWIERLSYHRYDFLLIGFGVLLLGGSILITALGYGGFWMPAALLK